MNIRIEEGLPVATVTLTHGSQQLTLANVVIDTGSASTIFAIDRIDALGIGLEPQDVIIPVRGIGGTEFVFEKHVDVIELGDLVVRDADIDIGAMDYGFEIDGIVGIDFLVKARAVIDLAEMNIHSAG
jgi:hypothetical protein